MLPLSTLYKLRKLYEYHKKKFKDIVQKLPIEAQAFIAQHWYFAVNHGHMTRLEQIIDWAHDWYLMLFKPGRRWGKTYCGSHNVVDYIIENPGVGVICIAASFDDAKKILIEGESGVLNALNERGYEEQENCDSRTTPNPRMFSYICSGIPQIKLDNGSVIHFYTAGKASKLRGRGVSLVWADEMLTWFEEEPKERNDKIRAIWDQIVMILSQADVPRILVTSTPTPILFLKDVLYPMIKEDPENNILITGSLNDNPHLSAKFKEKVNKQLGGTRKGRQEIEGSECFEIPGALWKWEDILRGRFLTPQETIKYFKEHKKRTISEQDAIRHSKTLLMLGEEIATIKKIAIGVDPSVSNEKNSDETGIVTACKTECGRYAVLRDDSGVYTVDEWSRKVVEVYKQIDADIVVYEKNNGGALIESAFKQQARKIDCKPRLTDVWAARGKFSRAEQPSMLYEQKLVYHIGNFTGLEEQMTTYNPEHYTRSPDKMDALVWVLIHLSDRDKPYIKIL